MVDNNALREINGGEIRNIYEDTVVVLLFNIFILEKV